MVNFSHTDRVSSPLKWEALSDSRAFGGQYPLQIDRTAFADDALVGLPLTMNPQTHLAMYLIYRNQSFAEAAFPGW